MAENKQQLEARTFRECDFYIRYLQKQFDDLQIDDTNKLRSIDDCLDAIEDELDHFIKDDKKYEHLINKMMFAFNSEQLDKDDFLWLSLSDERLCNWVWCYLRSKSKKQKRHVRRNTDDLDLIVNISDLSLGRSTNCNEVCSRSFKAISNNVKARRNDIIDSFHCSELKLSEQKEVIVDLLEKWKPIFSDKRIVNWLLKDDVKQHEWVWEYLSKFDSKLTQEVWSPTNDNELKSAIISLFDLLHDQPDRKTLLIGNMKRAWSQKKFRDKNEGKKAYSISMTESTKQKLDTLAEHKGLKINETVELLIRNEFKNL
ncbi:hypothetical protein FR729_15480 [Vibrio alginolyticus]|uniref:hypothetical protein n=1 Tax=Vibrio alginolyticus TaxID=663 RepID=UPI00142860B1|nr:hypothetical protein [Vibrio alginolyticus]QIR94353.1 hypothetical protein FR729_15480 [Vibrio alginolyticus]